MASPHSRIAVPIRRFTLYVLPPVFQGGLSIILLPIMTMVLGPQDYAAFALIMSLMAIASMLASLGNPVILAKEFPDASHSGRSSLVSTLIWMSLIVSSLLGLLFLALWFHSLKEVDAFAEITDVSIVLAILAMTLSVPWIIGYEVLTLIGDAFSYAMVIIGQSIVTAIVNILAVFVFDAGGEALFYGNLAGAAVGLIGTYWVLKAFVRCRFELSYVRRVSMNGLLMGGSGLLDAAVIAVERVVISSSLGQVILGLYFHAQQYMQVANLAVKAVLRTIWPRALEEARESGSDFSDTMSAWRPVYALFAALGIVFLTFGDSLIGLLTNGKFNDAAPYAAYLMAVLAIRFSGRPQHAVLYSAGAAKYLAAGRSVANVAALGLIVILVPAVGVWGAIAALAVQAAITRVAMSFAARRLRSTPLRDLSALSVVAAIIGVDLILTHVDASTLLRGAIAVVGLSLVPLSLAVSMRHLARAMAPGGAAEG